MANLYVRHDQCLIIKKIIKCTIKLLIVNKQRKPGASTIKVIILRIFLCYVICANVLHVNNVTFNLSFRSISFGNNSKWDIFVNSCDKLTKTSKKKKERNKINCNYIDLQWTIANIKRSVLKELFPGSIFPVKLNCV